MNTRPRTTALAVTDEPQLRIVTCDEGFADVGPFRVPMEPMIGVVGVAPAGAPVSTFYGGDHGGNMDTRLIAAGSRLFLRAYHDGAMLYFGDVHAAMGDGEVFLSGIEIAGRITIRVSLAEAYRLPVPLVETADVVAPIATGQTLDEAASEALRRGHATLLAAGMDPIDAGYLMSAAGHLRICQYLPHSRLVHCRFELPKTVLGLNGIHLPGLGGDG
jgi:amidase